MNVSELAVVDVRGPLTAQRGRLLSLLTSLNAEQWAAPTAAPAWSVKDIALHLLDVDLNWVARDRDHDRAGMIPMSTRHEEFVRALGERNQRWVVGTRGLSPRLVTGLLQWAGEQLDAHLGTIDLASPGSVYWAGEVPLWFDLAREFTERWVHYRQIREAAVSGGADQAPDEFLPLVLRTFVWGFPHQYRAPAPAGATIGVEVPGIGAWTLTRTATGWSLDEGEAADPAARLSMSGEAAWRLLTGARYDATQVRLSGDMTLAEPLLSVRGIIVLDNSGSRHRDLPAWGRTAGSCGNGGARRRRVPPGTGPPWSACSYPEERHGYSRGSS
jgi:Mycothiol maleylpyruvate isomerase N-terminal domain